MFLGLAVAQETPYDPWNRNITYNETLACGSCITGGYNFCFYGKDGDRSHSPSPGKDDHDKRRLSLFGDNQNFGEGKGKSPKRPKHPNKWHSICCEDGTCAEMRQKGFTCSNDYSMKEYAMTMCPDSRHKCGSEKNITFNDEGNKTVLRIFNLTEGETCTYKLNAECGSPYFKVD